MVLPTVKSGPQARGQTLACHTDNPVGGGSPHKWVAGDTFEHEVELPVPNKALIE